MITRLKATYNRIFKREQIAALFKRMEFQDNTLKVLAEHPTIAIIANEIGKSFIKAGAVNYLEMTMFDPATIGFFTILVTPQKHGVLAQGQIINKYRDALERIAADPHNAAEIAQSALRAVKPAAAPTPREDGAT